MKTEIPKKISVPHGQLKRLASEWHMTSETMRRYLNGEVDIYSTAYPKQEAIRKEVWKRFGQWNRMKEQKKKNKAA